MPELLVEDAVTGVTAAVEVDVEELAVVVLEFPPLLLFLPALNKINILIEYYIHIGEYITWVPTMLQDLVHHCLVSASIAAERCSQ